MILSQDKGEKESSNIDYILINHLFGREFKNP